MNVRKQITDLQDRVKDAGDDYATEYATAMREQRAYDPTHQQLFYAAVAELVDLARQLSDGVA